MKSKKRLKFTWPVLYATSLPLLRLLNSHSANAKPLTRALGPAREGQQSGGATMEIRVSLVVARLPVGARARPVVGSGKRSALETSPEAPWPLHPATKARPLPYGGFCGALPGFYGPMFDRVRVF